MVPALALALSFVTPAGAAPGETLLDICRSAYESFEPRAAVKSCSAAADVDELSMAQRIQALRYLGQSQILANEDDAALQAFMRMLVLDDALLLTRDAGPRERDVFARARATLDKKGRIEATHTLDEAGNLRVDVRDPLARVARARVRVRNGERISVAGLAAARDGGVLVVTGPLPVLAVAAVVDYEILLDGHTGAHLAIDAPLHGTRRQRAGDDEVVGTAAGTASNATYASAVKAKPLDGFGYAVLASGVGLEALWLFVATPVFANTLETDQWVPFTLTGALAAGAVIAAGAGIVWLGPEELP
jgi:hypothetical protein